jgi:hypothetical protein
MSVYQKKGYSGWYIRCRDGSTGKQVHRYGGDTKFEAEQKEIAIRKSRPSISNKELISLYDFIEQVVIPIQRVSLTTDSLHRNQGIVNNHLIPFLTGRFRAFRRRISRSIWVKGWTRARAMTPF